jgi:PAS domain S-box-containing protein
MEMYPKIEVGYAVGKGDAAFLIGQETARNAVSSIHEHAISAVLVFSSVRYDLEEVLKGIGSIVSEAPVLGTTTAGEVCNGLHGESVVVVALASPHLKIHCALGHNVSQDWQLAVEQAINSPQIAPFFQDSPLFWQELTRGGKTVFAVLFSPGNTRAADTHSYEILEELKRKTLGRIPIFGGASGDDWRLEKNYVLLGQQAFPDSILLAIIETELQVGISMGNGFRPSSFQTTINSVEGHEILTMDGRPSAEVFAEALGISPESLEGKHLTLTSGHAFGISDSLGEYSINVASYITPRGGIRFTQPVLPGTLFTLMSSQSEDMVSTGQKVLRKAMLRGGITDPACAIVCYCALRPRLMGKDSEKEIRLMRDITEGIPLVGFCSFGEQGVSDDGMSCHDNAAITALIIGRDLSHAATVARENDILHKKLMQKAEELEKRVEERTFELKLANLMLEQDIVERKQADESLKQSFSLLRATLESTADGILVVDGTGKITTFNARFAELWRLPSDIITSLHDAQALEFVTDQLKDSKTFLDKVRQLYDHPEMESFDVLEFKDGRVFERFSRPQWIGQQPVGRVWSFRDVTEREQAEKELHEAHAVLRGYSTKLEEEVSERTKEAQEAQLQAESANIAKSAFITNMSHELRTPLNAIIGFSDTMLNGFSGPLSVKQTEYIDYICQGGKHLQHLIDDILDLSRIEAGKMELNIGEFLVKNLIDSTMLMFQEKASRHGLKLTYEIEDSIELMTADAIKVKKVLFNLLDNAVKFTPEGGKVHVAVTLRENGEVIEFSVKDTGIGLSSEDQSKLFIPFTQLDSSYSKRYEGTGLGLSLCRKIADLFGGNISVQSQTGKGSIFYFTMPLHAKL